MRNIKFRGYSKNFNMMILNETWESASDGMVKACNQYIKEHHIDSIPIERGTFLPTKDNDMILMQYTEINDDNGIEIYEDDIVKRISMAPGGTDCEGKVEYSEGQYWITNSFGANSLFTEIDSLEVIGNIYE